MKRPSFQFYPGDWQANSNLRRCTHAEKGVWLDVLCLMHDQPEYGVLRWPLKEIAQAVGASVALLRGLETKGILKGADVDLVDPFIYIPRSGRKDGEPVTLLAPQAGPIWYSSRMVKDEHVRTVRGDGTRFGDEDGASPTEARKMASKGAPNPPFGDGPSSSSSSSSSKKPSVTPSMGFAEFWATWPRSTRKGGKPECVKLWEQGGLEIEVPAILAHVEAMKATDSWRKQGGEFIPAPAVYLRNRRWDGAEMAEAGGSQPWAGAD